MNGDHCAHTQQHPFTDPLGSWGSGPELGPSPPSWCSASGKWENALTVLRIGGAEMESRELATFRGGGGETGTGLGLQWVCWWDSGSRPCRDPHLGPAHPRLAPSCSALPQFPSHETKVNSSFNSRSHFLLPCSFFKCLFICFCSLKRHCNKRDREAEAGKEIFSLLVHSPNACNARSGPDQHDESRFESRSHTWVAGAQAAQPSSGASQVHSQEAGSASGGRTPSQALRYGMQAVA